MSCGVLLPCRCLCVRMLIVYFCDRKLRSIGDGDDLIFSMFGISGNDSHGIKDSLIGLTKGPLLPRLRL